MSAAPQYHPIPLSVSAISAQLRELIEGCFPSIWVTGELSNFTRASSGHWYFTLKDAGAQLKAVMFRGCNLRMRFDPRDGLDVFARGRLTVYTPRGDYQFLIEEMHPKGIGAAELGLRQLRERLATRGYFHPQRKRRLPRFPRRVGLIVSAAGAAVRDMVELFAQRWPYTELIIRASRVQGDGAALDVATAIKALNHLHATGRLAFDAIVLGRGGGRSEDLGAFNDERVAHAIYASHVPVVSAVGHEIDVTIADLVADHRAETPTAAVVALTPDRRELRAALRELGPRLYDAVNHRLELARQRVRQVADRPVLRRPLQYIHDLDQRLDHLDERMARAVQQRLGQASQRVAGVAARLETLSPLNVLARGYSLTQTERGDLVRSADDVAPGDVLVTRVERGTIRSRVE